MGTDAVAVLGFVALFALMLLRVPVGMAMGLVGVCGFGYLVGFAPALKLVGQTSMRTVTDYTFGVIPMFLLMGTFVSNSGMSRELFRAANGFVGHLRGGLGIATVAACGGFAAICGSSVATAATFSAVAYPEMRRFGYPQSFATGVIAAGGTLGAMLPPSTVLAVYGIITEQDIGKLFIAGIIPGILAMTMYMITIALIGWFRPDFLPTGPQTTWRERFAGLKNIWAPVLLFIFVIGGLYGLPFLPRFTPTEAGGVGATGAFLIGVLTGRLDKEKILNSLLQATRTAAAVFTVLIGALIFGYFLTVTQTPQKVTELLTGLGLGPYGILALIMVMYLVLGCLMDAMAMIILTVPIIFPVIIHLGFDPIWFGVIIVMTVELGLIHPPVGMNVFVIKSVVKDVSFSTIFRGVIPFVVDRPDPAGDPDRISDPGAVVAAGIWRTGHHPRRIAALEGCAQIRTPMQLHSDQIRLHHHRPDRRGDVGRRDRHRRAPDHSDHRRRGEGRGHQRQGLRLRRRFPDHPAQRTDRAGSQIRLRDRRRRGGLCREQGPALRPGRTAAKAQARRAGRSQADLFPHRAAVRDRGRKIPLADGKPVHRLRRPPRRPRRHRRASGAVSAFTLTWRGRVDAKRRGGVTVSPRLTVPELSDHPTSSHISLCSMRADRPPPGEGANLSC